MKKSIKIGGKNTRPQRIKNCKTCKGEPPESPINLSDWKGIKCSTCFEVINATKI